LSIETFISNFPSTNETLFYLGITRLPAEDSGSTAQKAVELVGCKHF